MSVTPAEERTLAAWWQLSLEELARLAEHVQEAHASRYLCAQAESWYQVLCAVVPVLDRLGVAGIRPPRAP